jgi:hypothetical protein
LFAAQQRHRQHLAPADWTLPRLAAYHEPEAALKQYRAQQEISAKSQQLYSSLQALH